MNRFACAREQDVLDAIASRRWPARCEQELRDHVVSCGLCADLVAVAGALLDPDATEVPARDLPPASLVWWRVQLRAREEAARSAVRPIRLAQLAALACIGVLVLAAVAAVTPFLAASITSGAARVALAIPKIDAQAATEAALASLANRGVQLAAGAWLVLGPVAIYLALARD